MLVWPTSIDSLADGTGKPDCSVRQPLVLRGAREDEGEPEVAFTYSLTFVDSPTVWATRWDPYFRLQGRVRFLSIANSLLIAAFRKFPPRPAPPRPAPSRLTRAVTTCATALF